jgi:hypothetical protein
LGIGIEEEAGFACYCEFDSNDELTEFAPEAYLASPLIPEHIIQEAVGQLIREFGAFNLKYEPKLKKIRVQRNIINVETKQYGKKSYQKSLILSMNKEKYTQRNIWS